MSRSAQGVSVGLTVAQGQLHQMPNTGALGINEWAVSAAPIVQQAYQQQEQRATPPASSAGGLQGDAEIAGSAPNQPLAAATIALPPQVQQQISDTAITTQATGSGTGSAAATRQLTTTPQIVSAVDQTLTHPVPETGQVVTAAAPAAAEQPANPPSASVELQKPSAPPRSLGWFR